MCRLAKAQHKFDSILAFSRTILRPSYYICTYAPREVNKNAQRIFFFQLLLGVKSLFRRRVYGHLPRLLETRGYLYSMLDRRWRFGFCCVRFALCQFYRPLKSKRAISASRTIALVSKAHPDDTDRNYSESTPN